MEFDRKCREKSKTINPICIKENNMNLCNMFDTSFKSKKNINDGFDLVTKLKRNFK